MNEPTKAHQEKVKNTQRIKAAYEEAKKKGLVTSRPIIINKPPLDEGNKNE